MRVRSVVCGGVAKGANVSESVATGVCLGIWMVASCELLLFVPMYFVYYGQIGDMNSNVLDNGIRGSSLEYTVLSG